MGTIAAKTKDVLTFDSMKVVGTKIKNSSGKNLALDLAGVVGMLTGVGMMVYPLYDKTCTEISREAGQQCSVTGGLGQYSTDLCNKLTAASAQCWANEGKIVIAGMIVSAIGFVLFVRQGSSMVLTRQQKYEIKRL